MIVLWIVTTLCLVASLLVDRKKTWHGVRRGIVMFLNVLPYMLAVLLLAGLFLAVVPNAVMFRWLGRGSGLRGLTIAALLGSTALIPGFVAFPLGAMLIKNGIPSGTIAVFITTLMMVGVVTLPVERKYFGLKTALLRNDLSFIGAVVIGLLMGLFL